MGADQKRREARKRKFGALISSEEAGWQSAASQVLCQVDAERQNTTEASMRRSVANFAKTNPEDRQSLGADGENPTASMATEPVEGRHIEVQDSKAAKSQRFIVFIGNLPFSATHDSIDKHFTKVQPHSIRHPTDRNTGKSKGFAFLEFEAYDRMKTCLKVYHHSNFDDGESSARRINVELTAGGGGAKSKERKAKLKIKNMKLAEERQRRATDNESQAKIEERATDTKKVKTRNKMATVDGNSSEQTSGPVELHGDIHPSRRDRIFPT